MTSFVKILTATAFVAVALFLAPQAAGQAARSNATPRMKDGKPDFSGMWNPDAAFTGDISKALKPGEKLPLLPSAQDLTKVRNPQQDPRKRCLPNGVPRLSPAPEKMVQTPTTLVILYEGDIHSFRQIFLDGRGHPPDIDPTWYGDSIGRWEGDTLVVDTIGFNDRTWLDSVGHPHTDKLHVTERYRRPDAGTLRLDVTIEDPGAYSKPFTVSGSFKLVANREIREYVCNDPPDAKK